MNNQRLGVQHLSPIKTAEQLAQVAIEQPEGAAAGAGARCGWATWPTWSRTTSP